jgi:hypothetical protein
MERLTEVITDVFGETRVVLSEPSKNSICNGCLFPSECDRCSLYKAIKKLNDIENILGDEYDLDRLRELAQADKENRVLPEGSGWFVTCSGKKLTVVMDIEAALRRKQDG